MPTLSKFFSKLSLTLFLATTIFAQSSQAATSNGSDGVFLINDIYTLNATNNQVFNFTTFDVLSSSVLSFSGLTATDTVTFLATGDINLGGILNFSSNVNFETSGNIFVSGTINVPDTSVFSLSTNGAINIASGSVINIGNNPIFNVPPKDIVLLPPSTFLIPPKAGAILPVPEPKTYLQLLCGLALLALARRKSFIL